MPQSDDTRTVLAALRPQPFGKASSRDAHDPVIEPMWAGIRVLAAVDADGAVLVDEDGDPVEGHERIVQTLAAASRVDGVVIDGYLTKQALRDDGVIWTGASSIPTTGQMITSTFIGLRRNRAQERVDAMDAARDARTFGSEDTVTFVVTDLLWLDGESLLDVPLLERRRVLESVLDESDVVRLGVYVRPPIETWVGSWRAQGFTGLTFKAANSRYSPGVAKRDWATTPMPRR